jgi:hypothetical protein
MAPKFILIFLFALPSLAYAGYEDSTQTTSGSTLHQDRITLDLGVFLLGVYTGDGWEPQNALRAGFGKEIRPGLILNGHLEYYEFNIEKYGDHTQLVPKSAKRHDIAAYAGILFFETVEIGIGGYYTKSDPVTMIELLGNEAPWGGGGQSGFRTLVSFGIQHEFDIVHGVFLPVGLYLRNVDYGNGLPFLRLGLGMKF